jgi:hypothetical protein
VLSVQQRLHGAGPPPTAALPRPARLAQAARVGGRTAGRPGPHLAAGQQGPATFSLVALRVRPAGITRRRQVAARTAGVSWELPLRWLLVEWRTDKAEPVKYWPKILPLPGRSLSDRARHSYNRVAVISPVSNIGAQIGQQVRLRFSCLGLVGRTRRVRPRRLDGDHPDPRPIAVSSRCGLGSSRRSAKSGRSLGRSCLAVLLRPARKRGIPAEPEDLAAPSHRTADAASRPRSNTIWRIV